MSLIQKIKWKKNPPKIGEAPLQIFLQKLLKRSKAKNGKELWWFIFLRWLKLNKCYNFAYRRRWVKSPINNELCHTLCHLNKTIYERATKPSEFTDIMPWGIHTEWKAWVKENGEMVHYYKKKYHIT